MFGLQIAARLCRIRGRVAAWSCPSNMTVACTSRLQAFRGPWPR